MNKRFTGGDIFKPQDGLPYYLHKTLMQNELRGGYGAYELSNAQKAASGLSFSGNQYDLAHNAKGRILFEKIAVNVKDEYGNRLINQQELKYIQQHFYKPCGKFSNEEKIALETLKPKINQMLSSPQGIELINKEYAKSIVQKSQEVKNIINQVQNPHNKKILQNSLELQVAIADIRNQHGTDIRKKLNEFLNHDKYTSGIIMYKTKQEVLVKGEFDIEDLKAFRLATDYAMNKGGEKNAVARIENIKKIMQAQKVEENNYLITTYQKPKELGLGHNKQLFIISEKHIQNQQNIQQDKFNNFKQVMQTILPDIDKNTVHITSKFGYRTLNSHQHKHHGGIDMNYIGGQRGINLTNPNIHSPISGKVIMVGGAYGTIKILDANGFSHEILHTKTQKVTVGQTIKIGEVIATMGKTAPKETNTTDQHVHYQIKKYSADYTKAQIFNPINWWVSNSPNKQIGQYSAQNNPINSTIYPQKTSINNKSNQLSSSTSSNMGLLSANLDKSSEAYKMLHNALGNMVPNFIKLNSNQQDEIIKNFIEMQNKQLITQTIKQTRENNQEQNNQYNTAIFPS